MESPELIQKKPQKSGRRFRWKDSLYSRALLFTAIGCGCLFGAILAQSWVMVNGTVERLLQERTSLARATGSYLEEVLHHDLDQIAAAVAPTMSDAVSTVPLRDRPDLRQALSNSYSGTVFGEGAFVLDSSGGPLASVPESDPSFLRKAVDLESLARQARATTGPIASPLVLLSTGRRPVVILLKSIRNSSGAVLGFLGGFLHPASNNLLKPFEKGSIGTAGTLQLLDATGAVVASTREKSLFTLTDHGSLISGSIRDKTEIRGRCHSCHEEGAGNRPAREMEVLAFAPLPSLQLGIAVRQPEAEALAPAFALERRLLVLGLGFIVLFLIFTGLSVFSVVSPLTRLTRAVGELEGANPDLKLPSFGRDEVGQLANAVERWRSRLEHEVQLTRRNLTELQEIAELGSKGSDVEAILKKGLDALLRFTGLTRGLILLTYDKKSFSAGQDLSMAQIAPSEAAPDTTQMMTEGGLQITRFESPAGSLITARLRMHEKLSVACTLAAPPDSMPAFEDRRFQSILHQIVISVANRLLHDEEARRHKQSREFLQKMLNAQEEERRRIARELHDTLAQDLAAHRLELERTLGQAGDGDLEGVRTRVRKLEEKAHEMLSSLRQMLLDLRPSVLDTMGFLPAIQWYLERTQREHGVHGSLSVESDELKLSPEMEVALFRIFQEGLQNVIQHAKATHIMVTVNQSSSALEMTIEDDGRGFDPVELENRPKLQARGLGIMGMRERTALLGGTLDIQSSPGEGASFIVKVPLEAR